MTIFQCHLRKAKSSLRVSTPAGKWISWKSEARWGSEIHVTNSTTKTNSFDFIHDATKKIKRTARHFADIKFAVYSSPFPLISLGSPRAERRCLHKWFSGWTWRGCFFGTIKWGDWTRPLVPRCIYPLLPPSPSPR